MAQYRDGVTTLEAIVGGCQQPVNHRLHAQDRKVTAGDEFPASAIRLVLKPEVHVVAEPAEHVREHSVLIADFRVRGVRELGAIAQLLP